MIFLGVLYGQELTVPGYECGDCHGTGGWDELELSNFSHVNTNFQLEGTHDIANCSDCHKGSTIREKHSFGDVSTSCNSCHLDIHKNYLGGQCSQCHTSKSWIVEQRIFNHEETRFSLMGAHRFVNCSDCHDDLTRFDVTPSDCYSCHRSNYDKAENPSHFLARISTDCQECHDVQGSPWGASSFNHDVQTLWPLTGAHNGAECAGCHQGIFLGTPDDCWSCHQQDYEATGSGQFPDAPNHVENNLNQNCEICHTTVKWIGAEVNHDLTEFPLTGSHQNTDCEQCHGTGNYDLPLDCSGCHTPSGLAQTDYTISAYNHDSHNIAGFCESCHTTSSWQQLIFSHTSFTNESCLYCHAPEYETSADPPHADGNISSDCQLCHSTENWQDETFTHSLEQTGFVLHGLHVTVDCQNCHANNVYNGLSINCESSGCHLSTYESTTDPNHSVYGYPFEYCDECHNENGWEPIIFSHQLSLVCLTCHMPDYNRADNPVHDENNGFSTTCEDCHTSTVTWEGATFSHEGITNGCNDCHIDDYNSTADPDHLAWGYPITCEDCHVSTTTWSDVNFNHSFPIAPNGHQNDTAESCTSCHPDGNADTFTCFGAQCHTEPDMVSKHCEDGANDCESCNGLTFPFTGVTSEDCVTCHPNGNEDDCDGGRFIKNKKKDNWKNIFIPY